MLSWYDSLVTSHCHGKLAHDESLSHTREVMMIAVGVGVAPMIQILRTILRASNTDDTDIDGTMAIDRSHLTVDEIKRHMNAQECFKYRNVKKVVLLYGVRTVSDTVPTLTEGRVLRGQSMDQHTLGC